MLTAADFSPSRARRRRRIIAATTATATAASLGVYLLHLSPIGSDPTATLEATSLAPHVVVFSVPLAHKDKDTDKKAGSDKKDSDSSDSGKKSEKKDSDKKDSGSKGDGGSSSPTSSSPAGSSSQASPAGWPTGSTPSSPTTSGDGSATTSGTGSATTSGSSGWGNLAPGSRAASALPPGIKASVPTTSSPSSSLAPASTGSTSQMPCTNQVRDMAALEKAVSDAGSNSAVICMDTADRNSSSTPASGPATAPSSYNPANTSNTVPPVTTGSSLPASSSLYPSTGPVTSPSGYSTQPTPTTTSQQARPAQMLSQIQCPSSMSQGSVCFEAIDSRGAAASLPAGSDLGRLPVAVSPGSKVSCPTQIKNNSTSTTRTTHDGTTTIEKTSKGSGKSNNSDSDDSDSRTNSDSTVASCGLLASSVDPSSDGTS